MAARTGRFNHALYVGLIIAAVLLVIGHEIQAAAGSSLLQIVALFVLGLTLGPNFEPVSGACTEHRTDDGTRVHDWSDAIHSSVGGALGIGLMSLVVQTDLVHVSRPVPQVVPRPHGAHDCALGEAGSVVRFRDQPAVQAAISHGLMLALMLSAAGLAVVKWMPAVAPKRQRRGVQTDALRQDIA